MCKKLVVLEGRAEFMGENSCELSEKYFGSDTKVAEGALAVARHSMRG